MNAYGIRSARPLVSAGQIDGKQSAVKNWRGAFSLVEILVAIGIVAILVALIFPAGMGMLESSRSAKCQANLRQIGQAFALFVGDNAAYPPVRVSIPGSDQPWTYYLNTYLSWGTYANKSPVGICPSAKGNPITSYGYNAQFTYGDNTPAAKQKNLSKLLLVADSTSNSPRITYSGYTNEMSFRHRNRANILFADGHIEAAGTNDVPALGARNNPDGKWNQFWMPTL